MRVLRRIVGGIMVLSFAILMILPDFLEEVANSGLRDALIIYAAAAALMVVALSILVFGCWLLFGD